VASAARPIAPPATGGAADAARMLARDLLGFAVLAATRAAGKALCMAALPRIVPRTLTDDAEVDAETVEEGKKTPGEAAETVAAAAAAAAAAGGKEGDVAALRRRTAAIATSPPLIDDPLPTSPSPLPRQDGIGSEPLSPSSLPGGSPRREEDAFLPASKAAPVLAAAPAAKRPRYMPDGQNYWVEIPCKLIVYSLVGINAVYTVPHLFQALGLKDYGL
jgi:hypothetical protein